MNKQSELDIIEEVLYTLCLYTQKGKVIDGLKLKNINELCYGVIEELEKLSDKTVHEVMIKLIKVSKEYELGEDVVNFFEDQLNSKLERLKKSISKNFPKAVILDLCRQINKYCEIYDTIISYYE